MTEPNRSELQHPREAILDQSEARPWPADRVERWPLDRLVPYARNARTHSEEQIAQIAASMREWGWTNPVLVDEAGMIIAGHGRILAARKLGIAEVPVMIARGWTEAQKRAYVLADNQLALNAAWDGKLLAAEISDLRAAEFDINLIGFSAQDLRDLSRGGKTPPDQAPDPPVNPVSRPGDLWICGEHRVLCGSATILADVEAVLGAELADMCFTDPPYNVNYANTAKDKLKGKNRPILNDALGDEFAALLRDACGNILTVTKGAIYICMSSSELDTLKKVFGEAGGRWSTFVIWAKNTFTLGRSDYQRQYEPMLYGWKNGADHYWCGARDQGDVWFIDKPAKNDLHPTMKPVALVERAIRNSSKSRDLVLDVFGGSGTTMIAAELAGRRARLVELDPKYADVIVGRWEAFTGSKAVLQATGQAFADVARERLNGNARPQAETDQAQGARGQPGQAKDRPGRAEARGQPRRAAGMDDR